MIKQLIIRNYKGIKEANIEFNEYKNIIVGNNGVGKSTIIEALSLALGYGLNKLEITPYLFNIDCIKKFKEEKKLPVITIDVIIDGPDDNFSGTNNVLHEKLRGLQLKISFDADSYSDIYNIERENCNQIPCEYYKVERNWFSDLPVKQLLIPFYVQLVDSSSTYFSPSSNNYIAQMINRYIGDKDMVTIKTCLRHLKDDFDGEDDISKVNEKIRIARANLKVSIDVTSRIILRDIICPFLDGIPVDQIGSGELCILKTLLSINKEPKNGKNKTKAKVVIIEEPESHLSHTKMYELISKIEDNIDEGTQLIMTTHNSFIANKLDLSNLILVENEGYIVKTQKINKDIKSVLKFFTKVSNYPTLRLILCKSAILVEGPTDEMVLTYYYQLLGSRHPFDDGIELISVEGIGFKEYVELARAFKKKIAIITDNDGIEKEELLKKRGFVELPNNIQVFTGKDTTLTTLEPCFVKANMSNIQELSDLLRGRKVEPDTEDDLVVFMKNNKTEWAYKLLSKTNSLKFCVPDYFIEAVKWIKESHE